MAVGVDGGRGGLHVAVVRQIGVERVQQVRGVLLVVAHQGRDRVLVEAAHLLGIRGERAEQQAVRAALERLGVRVAAHEPDVEHELRLLHGQAQLARARVARGDAHGGLRRESRRELARVLERAGQHRVHAVVPYRLGERVRALRGDDGEQAARRTVPRNRA